MAPYATLWDRDGIHNLGVVPGWRNSAAEAINNNGLVIGTSGWRACYWDSTGAHDLGAMIGTGYSHAKAVNNAGWIVGGGHVSSEVYRPYVWRPVPEPASILALLGGLGALALSRRR